MTIIVITLKRNQRKIEKPIKIYKKYELYVYNAVNNHDIIMSLRRCKLRALYISVQTLSSLIYGKTQTLKFTLFGKVSDIT